MMNRKDLKAQAVALNLEVTYTKYGVPAAINGQPIAKQPWLTLEAQVKQLLAVQAAPQVEVPSATPVEVAQIQEIVAESVEIPAVEGENVEECLASPTQIDLMELNHVTDTQDAPTPEPTPVLNHVTPARNQKHPLRGYTLSTKAKVCQALRELKRVSVERVQDVRVMARLLAKHFGAEVRIRVIEGVTWVLVQKGASRRAFAF